MHRSRVGMDAQKPGLARELHKAKFRAHHEKRLEEISRRAPGTGTVDNTRPYTANLVHLKTRPKKKAILAARDAEVERANRDLLKQMTTIFTTPSALLPVVDSVDGRGNGLGPCLSINVLCRKRELERIALENKTWMKHLKAVSSSYDAASWERERSANIKVMERLRRVRYVREKATPEEFSRRGVRHLRKQVARTRGQALEAGFSPVPRLFDDSGRRGKLGSGKKRGRRPRRSNPSLISSPSSPSNQGQYLLCRPEGGIGIDERRAERDLTAAPSEEVARGSQQQPIEDGGTEGIPRGIAVSVKAREPEPATDDDGMEYVSEMGASAQGAAAAQGEDDRSTACSDFEDEGEAEGEEQQYSEFEDEPKDDDEDQYSDFGEGESNTETKAQHPQRNGTNNGETSEGTTASEPMQALEPSHDDRRIEKEDELQRGPETTGEEQSGSGEVKVQADFRPGQNEDSHSDVEDVETNIGTASAGHDDKKQKQHLTSSGEDFGESATGQQPTLDREGAGGVEAKGKSGEEAVEAETGEDQEANSDIGRDHDIGIENAMAVEPQKPNESDPQRQDAASHPAGMGVGHPRALNRELPDGGRDGHNSSGGDQAEEGGESVESGYRSASFEGDGDTSESAVSGPAPEIIPARTATEISPAGNGENAGDTTVTTGPASAAPSAISSSERQPATEVEGGNGDASLSTPLSANAPLPVESQEHPAIAPPSSSEGPLLLEVSSSAANDDPSPPPSLMAESALTKDIEAPAVALAVTTEQGNESLQEAGDNAATAAADEGADAQSALAGDSTLVHQSSSKNLAKAPVSSAADHSGINAAGTVSSAPAAPETVASTNPPADVGAPENDDAQVKESRQSSEEPAKIGGGSSSLSVEVAPLENISTGPSLPYVGVEGTAPTTIGKPEELPPTTEPESRAEEAATIPLRADDEETSYPNNSMSEGGKVVSMTGLLTPADCTSESVERAVVQGEEEGAECRSLEVGKGVAPIESYAVQEGGVEGQEEDLVQDESDEAKVGGAHAEGTAIVAAAEEEWRPIRHTI